MLSGGTLKLTLFGGITGFDKSDFLTNFTLQCLDKHDYSPRITDPDSRSFIHYIKFEDVLIDETGSVDISRFLARPSLQDKIDAIESTYVRIGNQIEDVDAEHVFLDIHFSCLYHNQFFPPLYQANLNELAPSSDAEIKVVTLIDDVFNIWNTVRKREVEFPRTRLRLREILSWRSVELLQAEAVAHNYTTEATRVSNYLFSVRHPFVSLYNLIFSDDPICLYLSFPITRTRNLPDRVADINSFRQSMYKLAEELGVVIFDPVTIDELALVNAPLEGENRILSADNRWPLETQIMLPEPDWPIIVPENEVQEARTDIMNNVRPRDFKLIDNSIFTTVYRKNFGGPSTGVREEIRYTISRGKGVYVYDPIVDSDNGDPHPFDQDEDGSRDIDEFYDNIRKGVEFYRVRRQRIR